jgi:hypothetical protein
MEGEKENQKEGWRKREAGERNTVAGAGPGRGVRLLLIFTGSF